MIITIDNCTCISVSLLIGTLKAFLHSKVCNMFIQVTTQLLLITSAIKIDSHLNCNEYNSVSRQHYSHLTHFTYFSTGLMFNGATTSCRRDPIVQWIPRETYKVLETMETQLGQYRHCPW